MRIKSIQLIKHDEICHPEERDIVRITMDDGKDYWIGEDELLCLEYLKRIMPR